MKKATSFIAAAALALSASAAVAGSYTVPEEDNEIIIIPEDPSSSVGSLPIALIGLLIVGLAVASGGGSNDNDE